VCRETGEVVTFNCGSWRCRYCGKKKASRLVKQIGKWAEATSLRRMLTLTLDPSKIKGNKYDHIMQVWRKFRVYLYRRFKNVSFIWVLELQKNGNPHLHILISQYIPQAWISEVWDKLGGGKVVDIRWVDIHRVKAYVSKYFTKSAVLAEADIPRSKRRFSTSRDIRIWEDPDFDWRTCPIRDAFFNDILALAYDDIPSSCLSCIYQAKCGITTWKLCIFRSETLLTPG